MSVVFYKSRSQFDLESDLDMSDTEVSSPCCRGQAAWLPCCSHTEVRTPDWLMALISLSGAHTLLLNPYCLSLVPPCQSCDHTLVTGPCCLVLVLVQEVVPFVLFW